jgi:phosphate:Na+ symporter
MEKVVCLLVPQREGEHEDDEMKLKYIGGGLLSTAELSILEARKEVNVFITRLLRMYGMVQDLLHTTKGEEFNKLYSRIEKYESITDRMEIEIADYLTEVSEGRLSVESKMDIQKMMRVCSELESIGDSCFNMARTMKNKRQYANEDFTDTQYQHIHNMMGLVGEALAEMQVAVNLGEHRHIDLNKNYNTENEINNYRDQLKYQNIIDVNNKLYDYQIGVFYMDLISECEKLGDFIINVLESFGLKERKN